MQIFLSKIEKVIANNVSLFAKSAVVTTTFISFCHFCTNYPVLYTTYIILTKLHAKISA